MDDLKECPFCGGAAAPQEHEAHSHSCPLKALGIPDHPGSFTIECIGSPDCNTGQIGDTRAEVVAMWNRRAVPQANAEQDAARDVLAERKRQIGKEGWSAERDDKYIDCELARAAATYMLCTKPSQLKVCDVLVWPWSARGWKPSSYRRNLIKAGALILAEIERLDRAASKTTP